MEGSIRLKDIANKLGVSITTVSKALNNHPDISEKRRQQILQLVNEMKYVPNAIAKNLRKKSTSFIGVIVSDNTNPYYSRLIKGAEEEITKRNYQLIIFNTNENPQREIEFIKNLLSINVAGIIITPAKKNSESIKILKDFKIPYVIANRYNKKNEDNYVIADDIKAGFIATDYLIKKRFKKIILINSFGDITSAFERRSGYEKALKSNNIQVREDLIYSGIIDNIGGYKITRKVLADNKLPFSILCYSDYVASGVMRCLNEMNIRIPDEVAVMGIDNIKLLSFSHPALSTVSIPKFRIGKKSAKMLFKLINNPDYEENRLILEPKLVIRETA